MQNDKGSEAVVKYEPLIERIESRRKELQVNKGTPGSVRKINGKIYLDFRYLGRRVREPYKGLDWDGEKGMFVLQARIELNLIQKGIERGCFVFSEVFPNSAKAKSFTHMEIEMGLRKFRPHEVLVKDYISDWIDDLRHDSVAGRTLQGYNSNNHNYIIPYWGEMNFAQLRKIKLGEFYDWARDQEIRGEAVSNNSLNAYIKQLIRIATHAAGAYEWADYKPFLGYKPLPNIDPYDAIHPFTRDEQDLIFRALPQYWRPYVDFAFASGVSVGELNAIRPNDVTRGAEPRVVIDEAWTQDEKGNAIIGPTKNKYRNRTLKMNPRMRQAVEAQVKYRERLETQSEFFFCKEDGSPISDSSWFITNVWRPTLMRQKMEYRSFREARHSFATEHLSKGVDPLTIAAFMGHRDPQMVLKRYAKYKKKFDGVGVGMDDHLQRDYGV
jgi:integrase